MYDRGKTGQVDHGVLYRATGCLMIRSLALHNFRCFKSAEVKDCRRINVIVGRNASGKTSLLEALFLVMGQSPEAVLRIRQWRGVESAVFQGSPSSVQQMLWGDLFHNYTGDKSLHIEAKGDDTHSRKLTISHALPEIVTPLPGSKMAITQASGINFKWRVKGYPEVVIVPEMLNGAIKVQGGVPSPFEVYLFAANHTYSALESATRMSELSKTSKSDSMIEAFKSRYPNVESLNIELFAGSPMLYAKMKDIRDKLPLGMISGGMNKLAAILLAFPASPRCTILIDEIENGLYYKDLPEVWSSILNFAEMFDAQVFASTHSKECLEAAADVASTAKDKFSVIQAYSGRLHQFDGENFVAALQDDIEIR